MENVPFMQCGHTATGQTSDGKWVCVSCIGIVPGADTPVKDDNLPDLTGRIAECTDCNRAVPSQFSLPFFNHRGEHKVDLYYCGCAGWD